MAHKRETGEVKTEKPVKANQEKKRTKTNHQPGYRKPVKNPTTNYPPSTHAEFCKRCMAHNRRCPSANPKGCNI